MQVSTLTSWRSRSADPQQGLSWMPPKQGFFERHQIGQILSGLVMSSLLWGLLAVGVYTIYSLVLGPR